MPAKTRVNRDQWGKSDFIIYLNRNKPLCDEGLIEHPDSSRSLRFGSLAELILAVQGLLNRINYPQATTKLRSWGEALCALPDGRALPAPGVAGPGREEETMSKTIPGPTRQSGSPTFFVRIHYRQNATWQGSIQWLEKNNTKYFRSMLEMVMLMQEAVAKTGGEQADFAIQSWEDSEQILS